MSDRKSIKTLSRNFVIPAGSQVVLQVPKQTVTENDGQSDTTSTPDQSDIKKPGTVGVVIQCPPHNDLDYTIRFTDGSTAEATFDDIILRRQEVDNLLVDTETNFRQFVIYRCQVGSKAFGLSTDSSDDDYRGIFLPPATRHWSLRNVPGQIESNDGQNDEVYWELEKFLRLALKANPNILETLWTPVVIEETSIATRLREIRQAFLSKHLYKTYSGYVLSQFRRMKNSHEKKGTYKTKHAMHLLRLLHSGIGALKNGEIMIDVSEHRAHLMRVRGGDFTFEEVQKQALELDREFQIAFEATKLPEQPDFELVDRFLIDARQSMVTGDFK